MRLHSPWRTLGQRAPGIRLPTDKQALKAWVSSACSFPIPYALVTLQTERALDFASRIEHAPSPQSSPRKRGEAEWCRVSRTYRRKIRVAWCLPSLRSTSPTRINYLKLNAFRPRLSLCQRERMKVRVCFAVAPRVRTRLLARRYRVL